MKKDDTEQKYCSFCGKGINEVFRLIDGIDDKRICDECVKKFKEQMK